MGPHLIIDARHRLSWHQRLASDASTALLWSVWVWLWSPLLVAVASLAPLTRLTPAAGKLPALGAAGALEHSLVAVLGASGTLLVWKELRPARRPAAPPALGLPEQARDFRLPERQLADAREASVCVVHHDADGRIVRLEPRAPERAAARRSA